MKKKRSGSAQLKKHFNNLVCLWQSEFFCNWKDVNEENRSDFWKLECEIAWSKFYLCSLNWRHQCSWTHIHANNILVIIFAIKIPGINVIIFTFLELCYAEYISCSKSHCNFLSNQRVHFRIAFIRNASTLGLCYAYVWECESWVYRWWAHTYAYWNVFF